MSDSNETWWQKILSGNADDVIPMPAFVSELGITPDGWEGNTTFLKWSPPAWTRVPQGWVQGGFLAIPLDMAMSFAVVTACADGHGAVSIDLKINYLRTPFEDDYKVIGTVVKAGKTIAHTEGRIETLTGDLVATASAVSMIKKWTR